MASRRASTSPARSAAGTPGVDPSAPADGPGLLSATVPQAPPVRAAGAVVTRPGKQVLLVHRPRYDDWSFPKGKLERGEHPLAAAVREVHEETGLRVRLGAHLEQQRYLVHPRGGPREKAVDYWAGRVVDGADEAVEDYRYGDEIDKVAWVHAGRAAEILTQERDRALLESVYAGPRRHRTLVVLRHGSARARSRWREDDELRPLLSPGHQQARDWVPLARAYGVGRVMTSPSLRCVQTVQPLVESGPVTLERFEGLTEDGAGPGKVRRALATALEAPREAPADLLCTHRPVLPLIWKALGVPDPGLQPGHALAVHHRRGRVVGCDLVGP